MWECLFLFSWSYKNGTVISREKEVNEQMSQQTSVPDRAPLLGTWVNVGERRWTMQRQMGKVTSLWWNQSEYRRGWAEVFRGNKELLCVWDAVSESDQATACRGTARDGRRVPAPRIIHTSRPKILNISLMDVFVRDQMLFPLRFAYSKLALISKELMGSAEWIHVNVSDGQTSAAKLLLYMSLHWSSRRPVTSWKRCWLPGNWSHPRWSQSDTWAP